MEIKQYLDYLKLQGFEVIATLNGLGYPSQYELFNQETRVNISVKCITDEPIEAKAIVTIPGILEPFDTCWFSKPWDNMAFNTQIRRLAIVKQIIGDEFV